MRRRNTRVVNIGGVPLGGENPIRIQSMTTTDTMDTSATVKQSIRMIDAGCEYVRITTPSLREAENLTDIKEELSRFGYVTPLIADIHYTPKAAEIAAQIVEKVRINPGNFSDKNKNNKILSDTEYKSELNLIFERFSPLVEICKKHNTAMRIGVNHGSLSGRILTRYGDTPKGMVEAAMEFVDICRKLNYHDIVLSMKASNPKVMIDANRLLVKVMKHRNMDYPIHLGVTEAGEGEDGRIKSAIGIGTLLSEGIGDTIRVSLTEEPEFEIPVAREIIKYSQPSKLIYRKVEDVLANSEAILNIGGNNPPVVFADFSNAKLNLSGLYQIGYEYQNESDNFTHNEISADLVYLGSREPFSKYPRDLKILFDFDYWRNSELKDSSYPLMNWRQFKDNSKKDFIKFVLTTPKEIDTNILQSSKTTVLVIDLNESKNTSEIKELMNCFYEDNINLPIILKKDYHNLDKEQLPIQTSIDFGSLLIDNIGDGIWVTPSNRRTINTAFGILQATRKRITKTEYISCPSCGRTLFDIQNTAEKIRNRTSHLKGLKIGIMGCIVNGPGEMADADYGYVGVGVGKVSLYRGQIVVKKNIAEANAVDSLIELIRSDGKWVDAQ